MRNIAKSKNNISPEHGTSKLKHLVDEAHAKHSLDLWISETTKSRLCKIDAMKRKMEHMPNMTVIGNALTFKKKKQ